MRSIRLFIRQPFTQTSSNKGDLSKMMSLLQNYNKKPMKILPYASIGENTDFRQIFEEKTSIKFTPENFRNYRLNKIRECNAMFIMRNAMSESTAFELGYIYAKYPKLPIFFAIDEKHPITTTLVQDFHPEAVYETYKEPEDIEKTLYEWLDYVAKKNCV